VPCAVVNKPLLGRSTCQCQKEAGLKETSDIEVIALDIKGIRTISAGLTPAVAHLVLLRVDKRDRHDTYGRVDDIVDHRTDRHHRDIPGFAHARRRAGLNGTDNRVQLEIAPHLLSEASFELRATKLPIPFSATHRSLAFKGQGRLTHRR
jgi:hypothetical protein